MGDGLKEYRRPFFPAAGLFPAGFLLGCILPNAAWRMEWRQKTIAGLYLMAAFAEENIAKKELFFQILRLRGSYFFLTFLSGFSIFGAPLAVMAVFVMGFVTGLLLAMSVLQFGLTGGAVGMGLLFPHYLVYLPVSFCFLREVYRQSAGIWKNRGLFPQKCAVYIRRCFLAAVCCLAGMVLEAWCNPWVTERLLNTLHFF